MPRDLTAEFRWCILAVGTSAAAQFCLFVHSAALGARQRHDLATASHIVTQVVYACGVPLVLFTGGGLVGLSLWLSATNVFAYLLRWRLAKRILPELAPSLRLVDRAGLAEFAHFGIWQFLVNLSQQIIGYSDAIVIAVTLNTAAVAPFYLASRVARYFTQVFLPVGIALFPAIVHLDAVGHEEQIRRMYLRGSRLLWLLAIGLGTCAALWSGEFFELWVGERQAGFEGRVSDLFGVLLIAAVVTAPQQMSVPAYLALDRQRSLAALLTAEAVANLALSLALVRTHGLVGLAWGTCVPALLFQGVVHPVVTCRMLGVGVGAYCREALARPLGFGIVVGALSLLRPEGVVTGWFSLLAAGGCTGLIVAGAGAVVGLDGADRERFLWGPLRRVWGGGAAEADCYEQGRKLAEADYYEREPAEAGYYGRGVKNRSTGDARARGSAASTIAGRD